MKKILLLSFVMLACVIAKAEPDAKKCPKACPEFNPEKMIEFRAQAIVNKIGFDDATAAKFKEIYKAYVKEVDETVGKEFKKVGKKMKNACPKDSAKFNMSDADVKAAVKSHYDMQKKMLNLEEKYFNKFCSIMSPRQAQRVMASAKEGNNQFAPKGHQQGKCDKQFGPGKEGQRRGPQFSHDCKKQCDKQCEKKCEMKCDKQNAKCDKACEKKK